MHGPHSNADPGRTGTDFENGDYRIRSRVQHVELYPASGAAYYWLASYQRKGMKDRAAAAYLHAPPGSVSP